MPGLECIPNFPFLRIIWLVAFYKFVVDKLRVLLALWNKNGIMGK